MSLLAVDMGSSSCKAVAFSEDGCLLAQKTYAYSRRSPHPSWIEMSPENFWQALVAVIRAIAGEVTVDPAEVLAISSHGETFIPVDRQHRPVGPAILNADSRAITQANWLAETIGRERMFEITGLAVHAMYPLAKILWLRKHQPEVYRATACFLSLPGYLLTRLGLPPYVDYSLASRFLAFDIRKRTWSAEILSICELAAEQFPVEVPPGTVTGELPADIASSLGLRARTPVVLGGHDQPCAALGSGVIDPGRVSASLGTYECLVAASNAPVLNAEALGANLNSYCHVVPDRYVTLAYFPSGIMIEWFLRLIYSPAEFAGAPSVGELCNALEAGAPQGPTGLCITPHLLGSCNPDFDPHATGVIAGIHPSTTRSGLYKGILEGIACEFANMAEQLQRVAGVYRGVYISGGGVHSQLGLKLRAALAGRKLQLLQCPEAVCLGTAILAGIAAGKYGSFAKAVEQMVRVSETIVPDAATAESYKAQRQQYRVLYSSLAPVRRAQATCC